MFSNDTLALLVITLSLFSFLYVIPNFVIWMLTAEILWIGLYLYLMHISITADTVNTLIYGLLILCLATSESAIGLTLLLFNFLLTGNVHGVTTQNTWTWNSVTANLFSKI